MARAYTPAACSLTDVKGPVVTTAPRGAPAGRNSVPTSESPSLANTNFSWFIVVPAFTEFAEAAVAMMGFGNADSMPRIEGTGCPELGLYARALLYM